MTVDLRTIQNFCFLGYFRHVSSFNKLTNKYQITFYERESLFVLILDDHFIAELTKIEVWKRPNGWSLTIHTSLRERTIALAIEIRVNQVAKTVLNLIFILTE